MVWGYSLDRIRVRGNKSVIHCEDLQRSSSASIFTQILVTSEVNFSEAANQSSRAHVPSVPAQRNNSQISLAVASTSPSNDDRGTEAAMSLLSRTSVRVGELPHQWHIVTWKLGHSNEPDQTCQGDVPWSASCR